jgi:hypothetical protein
MDQAPPQVALLLSGAIPRNALGLGGAVSLPVAGMIAAPFPRAVAADLAILRIPRELALAVLDPPTPLTWFVRTDGLLGVKSGWCKLLPAERATSRLHPFMVGCAWLTAALAPREKSRLERNNSQPLRLTVCA